MIKKYITTDYANESDALMSILSSARHLTYRNPIQKMKAHCMPALKLLEKGNAIMSPDTALYAVRDILLQRVGADVKVAGIRTRARGHTPTGIGCAGLSPRHPEFWHAQGWRGSACFCKSATAPK